MCNVKPFLQDFGTFDKADTASYESVHRFMTVALWHLTSRRYGSMNEEMAFQSMLLNYHSINEFTHAFASNTLLDYIRERGPYVAPDDVEIKAISNMKSYPVIIQQNNTIQGEDDLDKLLHSGKLTTTSLKAIIVSTFQEQAWNDLRLVHEATSLTVLQGISIEGNEETKLGKVLLYATHNFQKCRARHDFILVQLGLGEEQPAQLLLLLQLSTHDNEHIQFFAIVRYLVEVGHREETAPQYHCPFPVFKLEEEPPVRGARQRGRIYATQLIDVKTIIGPAFMTPVFQLRNALLPAPNRPHQDDRFWYINRKFCDRAGWDDVNIVDIDLAIPAVEELHINIPDEYDDAHDVDVDSNSGEEDEEENADPEDMFGDWWSDEDDES